MDLTGGMEEDRSEQERKGNIIRKRRMKRRGEEKTEGMGRGGRGEECGERRWKSREMERKGRESGGKRVAECGERKHGKAGNRKSIGS